MTEKTENTENENVKAEAAAADTAAEGATAAATAADGEKDAGKDAEKAKAQSAEKPAATDVDSKMDAAAAAAHVEDADASKSGKPMVTLPWKFGRKKPIVVRRAWATVGVIVIVLVVAGVGFGIWHNQPGFCSTLCHSPMSTYVDGYNSDPSTLAYQHGHVVKSGDGANEKAAATLKSGVSDSSMNCLTCHVPKIGEQIAEAGMWLDGNYTVDQNGKLVLSNPGYQANKEFCTKCHDYEKVIASTEHYWGDDEPANPHASHQGDLDCSSCHNVHGTSTLMCSSCHNFDVPEGWQSVGQAQSQTQVKAQS